MTDFDELSRRVQAKLDGIRESIPGGERAYKTKLEIDLTASIVLAVLMEYEKMKEESQA